MTWQRYKLNLRNSLLLEEYFQLLLSGKTFSKKINPKVLFYGTSGRDFMLFGVLPDNNISLINK